MLILTYSDYKTFHFVAPCWFCADDEECNEAPVLNGTDVMDGSAYEKIGCASGCWVSSYFEGQDSIINVTSIVWLYCIVHNSTGQ